MKVIDELSIAFTELKLGVFAEKYQEIWDKCINSTLSHYHTVLLFIITIEIYVL